MNKRGLLLVVVTAVLVTLLAFAGGAASPRAAHAAGPGMSLAGPATVLAGETFTITVNADPAPDVEIAGFASEVVYPADRESGAECENAADDDGDGFVNDGCVWTASSPREWLDDCLNSADDDGDGFINDGCPGVGALQWLPRATCESEIQVARQDGEALGLCQQFASGLLGGAGHAVIGDTAGLPLVALSLPPGSSAALVELDFRCVEPGQHDLVLTATPGSPFGGIYANVQSQEIELKTFPYDVDGDTSPEGVAGVLTIGCRPCPDCPVPTPPPTPALDLTTGCTPATSRPEELAVLTCQTTISNSGPVMATGLMLSESSSPQFGIGALYRFSRSVDGVPVAVDLSPPRFTGLAPPFVVQPPPFRPTVPLPDLAPDDTMTIDTRVIFRPPIEGALEFQADVISNDVWMAGDTFSFDATPAAPYPPANLVVSQTLLTEIDLRDVPEAVEIEISIANGGAFPLADTTIFYRTPSDVDFVSADPPVTSEEGSTGLLTWQLGSLGVGEEARVLVTFSAPEGCVTPDTAVVVSTESPEGGLEHYAVVSERTFTIGADCSFGHGGGTIGAPQSGTGPATAAGGSASLRLAGLAALAISGAAVAGVGASRLRRLYVQGDDR